MTFNVGDHVRVTKRGVSFDENGMGTGYKWWNEWVDSMDQMVLGYYQITDYDQEMGYELGPRGFCFPENVLERATH